MGCKKVWNCILTNRSLLINTSFYLNLSKTKIYFKWNKCTCFHKYFDAIVEELYIFRSQIRSDASLFLCESKIGTVHIKTYSKRNVQPYFDATIDHILVHFKGSKGFICTKILLWNFFNSIDTFIFSTGLYVNWTLLFCIAHLIHWICKKNWHI